MDNKLKVIEIHSLSVLENPIFIVEIYLQDFYKGDVFLNPNTNLSFEILSIGSDYSPNNNTRSFVVKPLGEYSSVNEFKNKEFYKKL